MNTPWGESQYVDEITDGLYFVTTASHGGLMIRKDFAKENLSEAALKRGLKCNFSWFYAYEEDCDWAIPAWELPQYYNRITSNPGNKNYLLECLSEWNADYLLEIGVEPDPFYYEHYKIRKINHELSSL